MGLLLILPILVSGYLVCMNHPYYFTRLHRYDGQLLYLLVAKLGLTCILLALVSCGLASNFYPKGWSAFSTIILSLLKAFNVSPSDIPLYRFLLQLTCLSLLIPAPWITVGTLAGYLKGRYSGFATASAYYRARLLLDTPLGELLFNSISEPHQALIITMVDRKVYVGHVDAIGEASENESPHSTFSFTPVLSGYRDKDSLHVTLSTAYPAQDGIRVILREENIATASRWSAVHWESGSKRSGRRTENANRRSLRRKQQA